MPVEWTVQATEFANCNCAYGCGCQFNALPDKGFCEAVAGYQINQGHFGAVQLNGLRAAAVWHWPGAVHEPSRLPYRRCERSRSPVFHVGRYYRLVSLWRSEAPAQPPRNARLLCAR